MNNTVCVMYHCHIALVIVCVCVYARCMHAYIQHKYARGWTINCHNHDYLYLVHIWLGIVIIVTEKEDHVQVMLIALR